MIDFMKIIGRKTVKGEKTSAPKAVKASGKAGKGSSTVEAASKPAPTHDEIAKRAYEIYLARGADHGNAEQDWAQAESELGA